MKKLFSLSVFVTVMAFFAGAASVSQQQAMSEASAFILQKQGVVRTLKAVNNSPTLRATSGTQYVYVFNVGDNNGFVVVSGDDRTSPILGYSNEGTFDANKVPVNMQEMLDSYASQIKAIANMSDSQVEMLLAKPKLKSTTVETRNSVAPMITTNWDQATPYWNHCPEFMSVEDGDTTSEFAYTGCVATSMAQVMKYYNWPAQCSQTIPSYSVTYYLGNYEYGTFDTDELAPMAFDWEHMKDNYTGAEDQVYTDAVSWLMLYAGCAAHMQYGLSASGTSDPYVPTAFNDYFDYDATLVYRSDYDQETWEEMIYQELAAGRPMIYNGRAGSGGGHSFVCDGYEYGDYYHINWGWGGLGNGYFVLSILNPYAGGIGSSSSAEGYNIDQTAVIGIKPGYSGQSDEVEHLLTVYNMYYTGNRTLERGSSGFSFYKRRYVRVTAEDHIDDGTKYKRGIALYDSNDNFIELIASTSYYSSAISTTDSWPDTESSTYYYFGKSIGNGTYKIVPVCQVQNGSTWEPMLESDRYYIEMTVSGDNATLVDHPLNDLTATNYEFEGGEKAGTAEQCHVTVRNNSEDRFSGRLYYYLTNEQIDEYGEYLTVVETEIPAGGTKVVTFNFTPQNAGSKTAQLSLYDSSYGGDKIPGTGTVTIASAGSSAPMNLSVDICADNAVGTTIYDCYAHFKVDITNNSTGEYAKYVLAPLFIVNSDGTAEMVTYKQSGLTIEPGETKTLYFDFDNLAYGSRYALNIYGRNENDSLKNLVTPGSSIIYDITRGMVVWTTDGLRQSQAVSGSATIPANAVAVRLEELNLTSVTPNSNPNTIYLLGDNDAVPSGLAGKNVVKGQTATSIVLEDGYPYFVPQSVNASTVTYNRVFTTARTSDQRYAWSSIVLPFTATSVKVGSRNATLNSDYWLYNFPREENGVVTFDAATALESNVPYIVAVADGQNMTGQTMSWSASNVTLKANPIAYTSGENYLMGATYSTMSEADIYAMDTEGSSFVYKSTAQTVAPFRAYFKALQTVSDGGVILCPGSTEVTPTTYDKGDVNADGLVDVTDLNILVNIVLGGDSADNYDGRAYITDGDTVVDVTDVNALINLILE